MFSFPLGTYMGLELLVHMVTLCLAFKKLPICFCGSHRDINEVIRTYVSVSLGKAKFPTKLGYESKLVKS
jgi:hypothetical protein